MRRTAWALLIVGATAGVWLGGLIPACGGTPPAASPADAGPDSDTIIRRDAGSAVPAPTVCADDPPCDAGVCAQVTLGVGPNTFLTLAVGGSRVYWASSGTGGVLTDDGQVGYVDRCDGAGETLATQQKAPYNIAADSLGACWTNLGTTVGGDYEMNGEVWCGDGADLVELASAQNCPWGIAVDGTTAYWAGGSPGAATAVLSANRDGDGVATQLYATTASGGLPIALDSDYVYVGAVGQVIAVGRATGTAQTLAQGDWAIGALAVSDASVFFTDTQGTQLLTVSKTGGGVTTLAHAIDIGHQIATDGTYVYFTNGDLERVPIGGGATEQSGIGASVYALAADGIYVFITDGATMQRVRWL